MSRRHLPGAVVAVCTTLLVASCSTTVAGTAVSVFDDPFHVAGMPAVDGPTGLRPGAGEPSRGTIAGPRTGRWSVTFWKVPFNPR